MPNPQLNEMQIEQSHKLIAKIREEIKTLADDDTRIVFAFRRKIYKELIYDERGKPSARRKLKDTLWKKQKGICLIYKKDLPIKNTDLDRAEAIDGYTEDNVRLVHPKCHTEDQEKKGLSD